MFRNKKSEIKAINLSTMQLNYEIDIFIDNKLLIFCCAERNVNDSIKNIVEDIQSLITKRAKHRETVKEYSKTYDRDRQDKSHKKGRKG